jgi:hypothetical protein
MRRPWRMSFKPSKGSQCREYWMIYRWPCFLAVVWFGSSPTPFLVTSCLSFSIFLCVAGRAYWRERGERGWRRSQIIRGRESLVLSKNYSILFVAVGLWRWELNFYFHPPFYLPQISYFFKLLITTFSHGKKSVQSCAVWRKAFFLREEFILFYDRLTPKTDWKYSLHPFFKYSERKCPTLPLLQYTTTTLPLLFYIYFQTFRDPRVETGPAGGGEGAPSQGSNLNHRQHVLNAIYSFFEAYRK